jgi:trigger factor
MQSKILSNENNIVELEIEVEAELFDNALKKSYFKNVKKFNVPGFRKGKAPQHIIEKFYGEQVLYEDAIELIYPTAFDSAVAEQNLKPVERPEIDIKEIGKGKNFVFTAKMTVKPEVELGQYKGVEVEKAVAVVTDEEFENELKRIAEENSRLISVDDRPVQSGDTVIIDFEGFIDGEAFEGGSAENFSLGIGSNTFIPGFEDQIIGANTGDEVEVKVTFPEEYGSPEVAGKDAVFKVKVHEIQFREIPELDDEFAKDVSEFDTIEEYKADIREKLQERAEQNAKHENEDRVITKVVDNATVDIPEVMIERRVEELVYDFAMRLRYQGMELEQYLQMFGMQFEEFKEQFRERAENEVKMQLVLEKVCETEKIEVTEEEADEEFQRLAETYNQTREEFAKSLKVEDLRYIETGILARKTIDFLAQNAVFTEKEETYDKEEAADKVESAEDNNESKED